MRHSNPYAGNSWSKCQTCGLDRPSNLVWLNPRFGWQCVDCWDGLVHRDEIIPPVFPWEGTRRTPAPLTNTLLEGISGIGSDTLSPTYTYPLRDRITGELWYVTLPPFHVDRFGIIVYETAALPTISLTGVSLLGAFTALGANNGWDVYMRSGLLLAERASDSRVGVINGICDFGPIPRVCTIFMLDFVSGNTYTVDFGVSPPTVSLSAPGAAPVFNAVELPTGFFVVLTGTLSLTAIAPAGSIFSNPCTDTVVVPPATAPIVGCPTTVISGLGVDFTANGVPPSGVTITNYHWDFGDGNSTDTGTINTVHHDYATSGTYNGIVTVTASNSLTGTSGGCPVALLPVNCGIGTATTCTIKVWNDFSDWTVTKYSPPPIAFSITAGGGILLVDYGPNEGPVHTYVVTKNGMSGSYGRVQTIFALSQDLFASDIQTTGNTVGLCCLVSDLTDTGKGYLLMLRDIASSTYGLYRTDNSLRGGIGNVLLAVGTLPFAYATAGIYAMSLRWSVDPTTGAVHLCTDFSPGPVATNYDYSTMVPGIGFVDSSPQKLPLGITAGLWGQLPGNPGFDYQQRQRRTMTCVPP